jgi:hypothetical protein
MRASVDVLSADLVTAGSAAFGEELVRTVQLVRLPQTWRPDPLTLTYVYGRSRLDRLALYATYHWAMRSGLPNPRVITPFTLRWAQLFHPLFHRAATGSSIADHGDSQRLRLRDDAGLAGEVPLARFAAESTTFLAAVTLSTAVVQSRCSTGTLGSKYDRLWQLGTLADRGVVPELEPLALPDAVRALAADRTGPMTERLLAIRTCFERAVELLVRARPAERLPVAVDHMVADRTLARLDERFGFVPDIAQRLGSELKCIIVYGSSISGTAFADYDLILVCAHPTTVLRRLAGTRPTWRGKELNVGVYSPEELWNMQLLSGDNLALHSLCLYGEAEVPRKTRGELLARNLSFGAVRHRQQLGMIPSAMARQTEPDGDDRRNLYEYFVKIPANVAKGIWGASGRPMDKEQIAEWLRTTCEFDAAAARATVGATVGATEWALCAAAAATERVMRELNEELDIVTTGPAPAGVRRSRP